MDGLLRDVWWLGLYRKIAPGPCQVALRAGVHRLVTAEFYLLRRQFEERLYLTRVSTRQLQSVLRHPPACSQIFVDLTTTTRKLRIVEGIILCRPAAGNDAVPASLSAAPAPLGGHRPRWAAMALSAQGDEAAVLAEARLPDAGSSGALAHAGARCLAGPPAAARAQPHAHHLRLLDSRKIPTAE